MVKTAYLPQDVHRTVHEIARSGLLTPISSRLMNRRRVQILRADLSTDCTAIQPQVLRSAFFSRLTVPSYIMIYVLEVRRPVRASHTAGYDTSKHWSSMGQRVGEGVSMPAAPVPFVRVVPGCRRVSCRIGGARCRLRRTWRACDETPRRDKRCTRERGARQALLKPAMSTVLRFHCASAALLSGLGRTGNT